MNRVAPTSAHSYRNDVASGGPLVCMSTLVTRGSQRLAEERGDPPPPEQQAETGTRSPVPRAAYGGDSVSASQSAGAIHYAFRDQTAPASGREACSLMLRLDT
jgi:hypothetical protein